MNPKYSEKYQQIQELGRGSFGVAFLVKNKQNGALVVAKKLFINAMKQQQRQKSMQEVHILKQLNSPFIVKYFESFLENKQLIIIMEYCQEGELSNIINIHKEKKLKINQQVIANWFVQLCLGLKHIHQNKIIHRDIKTNNIFLNSNKTIKIGDFGISKVLDTISQSAHTFVGTPYYLSPEVVAQKPYGYKSDIWALGCVLYQLCTLNFVFEAKSVYSLLMKIMQQKVPRIPKNYSKELSEIALKILSKQVGERPTIDQIFQSNYIKNSMRDFLKNRGQIDINVSIKKTILHETLQSNYKNSITENNTIKSQYISTQKQPYRKLDPKQEMARRKQQKNNKQFQIMSKAAMQNKSNSFKNTNQNFTKQLVIQMSQINKTLASKTFQNKRQKALRDYQEQQFERKAMTYVKRFDPNDQRPLQTTIKTNQLNKKTQQKKPVVQQQESDDDDLQQYNDEEFEQDIEQPEIRITQAAPKQDLEKVQKMYEQQLKNKTSQIISPLNKNQSLIEPNMSFLLNIIEIRVQKLISELGKAEYKKLHDFVQANQQQLDEDILERQVKKKFPKVNLQQLEMVMEVIFRQQLQKTNK